MPKHAFIAPKIFDGAEWHERMALVVTDGHVEGLIAADSPTDAERVPVDGLIVPGFIDLQVNGGGGVLLNNDPTIDGIATICGAFAQFGSTGLMPTLITDTPEIQDQAIAAGIAALGHVPGFLGLHLEGPHLSIARKGAHDPALIRPMDEADIQRLLRAKAKLPNLIVTVAAETVGPEQISRLAKAGIIVSIGHSDATWAQVKAAADAGATMVTHLFNAQSQIGNREPGVVGAAIDIGTINAGLIADGIHVHPASIGLALRGKRGPGKIFIVTDAMSLTGTDLPSFELNGRTVFRKDGALRLSDGTLAGADLTMIGAIAYLVRHVGIALDEALRMASLYPAEALGIQATHGHLRRGARADFAVISDALEMRSTFISGTRAFG
ncbi:MAG TPA: N-acetylglucosamine-6-phosphate deacetylase [Devosia sp.]